MNTPVVNSYEEDTTVMRANDLFPATTQADGRVGTTATGPVRSTDSPDSVGFARELSTCHRRPLMQLAMQMVSGDRHRAGSLMQETSTRAWSRRNTICCGEVRIWLAVIARHLAVDAHIRRAHRAAREQAATRFCPVIDNDFAERVASAMAIRAAVAALLPHQRDVVHLSWAGHSVGETGAALCIPPGTVKSRVFHALAALRFALTADAAAEAAR